MLPADLVRAAQQMVAALARGMPEPAAVAWVHSAALVAHARGAGLIDAGDDVRAGVEALAGAHPRLAGLVDPATNPIWAHPVDRGQGEQLAGLLRSHSVAGIRGAALGDLYQAVSAEARKGRALCQTPKFVADLLLDLALPDAEEEFGPDLRVIDPSCGTGHLLVETAIRMASAGARTARAPLGGDRWARALAAVHGIELDGYAAAVAAYRLLALACRADGRRWPLTTGGDLPVQVATADALLDRDEPLLTRGRYHVAIGNPPYVTVKDAATNQAIRRAYPQVCSGQYSLALPFCQLMTDLTVPGGWVVQLTANSFMRREFGRRFVEQYLPRYDLRWVIDTSGAYIPGHGTPTVILVHRNQPPVGDTVQAVLGIRGEPSRPADPARGLVWTAIADAVGSRLAYARFARAASAAAEAGPPPSPAPVRLPGPAQPTLFDLSDGEAA